MRLAHSSISDVGKIRSRNEDSYFTDAHSGLYIVADGVGGHAGEAYASRACVNIVSQVVQRELERANSAESAFTIAVREANSRIFRESRRDVALYGIT